MSFTVIFLFSRPVSSKNEGLGSHFGGVKSTIFQEFFGSEFEETEVEVERMKCFKSADAFLPLFEGSCLTGLSFLEAPAPIFQRFF